MRQAGMAMVEALVASSLLGLGMLGAGRLTLHALETARQIRHLEQAQTLARQALDCALLARTPCPGQQAVSQNGVLFSVQLQTTPLGGPLHEVLVRVEWRGPSGPQQIVWRSRRSAMPDWLGVSSTDG